MPEPKVNILLVDDRPENLLALAAVLGDLGQNLVTAGSGSEALKHLLHDDFAVILLDVQMPEMDGFETAALIRSRDRSRHTPLIFLTAINKSETHVSRGYSMGAVDYVFKPFEPEALKSKVAAFVELSKKTRELEAEIVQRRRAEAEVRMLNEELERRVSERTAALSAANVELEREIAERKQLAAALEQRAAELAEADQRKDEFLAMLGHELRNPLAPIRNAMQVLQMAGGADARLVRAREIVDRQVRHMSRLVDDLLDVSRITRGVIQLVPEAVDLAALVRQAVETVRPELEARRHRLTLALPPEPLWLEADPIRLEQVVVNLLNNAVKYTEPGGEIAVSLAIAASEVPRRHGGTEGRRGEGATGRGGDPAPSSTSTGSVAPVPDPPLSPSPPLPLSPSVSPCLRGTSENLPPHWAVLTVRDTGMGMSPELLPRVFDLFAQAHRSLDRAQGGLGLGLTLVRRLVEMHGGSVTACSDGPGRGSEFIVRLPARQGVGGRAKGVGSEPSVPTSFALPPASSPRRVLVVDDNHDAAVMLADLAALWGCEARIAADGPAAIAAALAEPPDVVLLDIGLPGMDGYEVARRLREQEATRGALLVAITGYGQEDDRQRSRAASLDHHLTKPVDPDQLRQLLAGARAARPVAR